MVGARRFVRRRIVNASKIALAPNARLAVWAGVAIVIAAALVPPDVLRLGGGREFALAPMPAVALSALWIFAFQSAFGAYAQRGNLLGGSSFLGLLGLAVLFALAGEFSHALGALAIGAIAWIVLQRTGGNDLLARLCGIACAACALLAMRDVTLTLFTPLALFLPLLADAGLTAARPGRVHLYEIGARAGLRNDHVDWAYWFVGFQCFTAAIIAGEAARRASALDVSQMSESVARLTIAATLAPVIVFAVLALFVFRVSSAVRQFAAGRGLAD